MAWVMMIAHRRAVDRVRAERSQPNASSVRTASHAVAYDEVAETVEASWTPSGSRRCLGSLTELQREAVTLAYYGGYTYRQVAGLLGVAAGTVSTRMRDGLIRLRDCLGRAVRTAAARAAHPGRRLRPGRPGPAPTGPGSNGTWPCGMRRRNSGLGRPPPAWPPPRPPNRLRGLIARALAAGVTDTAAPTAHPPAAGTLARPAPRPEPGRCRRAPPALAPRALDARLALAAAAACPGGRRGPRRGRPHRRSTSSAPQLRDHRSRGPDRAGCDHAHGPGRAARNRHHRDVPPVPLPGAHHRGAAPLRPPTATRCG